MVEAKTVVLSEFLWCLLSVLLQPGIRPQPTISFFSEDGLYSIKDEGSEFSSLDYMRSELERERQRKLSLVNISSTQAEEIQKLKLDLEKERRRVMTQESQSGNALSLVVVSPLVGLVGLNQRH